MTSAPANPLQEFSEAWASIYPLLHWSLEHPVGTLFLTFVGLYLFWGLFRGLIYLTENLWIRLLRSPLWLVQSLWHLTGKKIFGSSTRKPHQSPSIAQPHHRLTDLIHQLEEGHRHQEQLLNLAKAELKKLEDH